VVPPPVPEVMRSACGREAGRKSVPLCKLAGNRAACFHRVGMREYLSDLAFLGQMHRRPDRTQATRSSSAT